MELDETHGGQPISGPGDTEVVFPRKPAGFTAASGASATRLRSDYPNP